MSTNIYKSEPHNNNPFGVGETSIDCIRSFVPFVRFAKEPTDPNPKLHSVDDPIPENVRFGSPIYYISDDDISRQERLPTGYEVSEKCIAKQIQNEAESEERVFYPIYVESDDDEHNLEKQIDWIRQFLNVELGIDPNECSWYFSGGRSIHAHTPYLATGRQLPIIREKAREFEHNLDPQIYSKKRQFRLTGATHDKGMSKVQIEPEWSRQKITREAVTKEVDTPDTFRDVLLATFDSDVLSHPQRYLWQPLSDSTEKDDPKPFDAGLNEWEQYEPNRDEATHKLWKAHYSHPVSPYRNAGNEQRSLLVAKVVDGAYGQIGESLYDEKDEEQQIILPCQILRFFSCDRNYQVDCWEHRPVRLSKPDYEKFNDRKIEKGDIFVQIGGQSRQSIIHKPHPTDAKIIAEAESFEEGIEIAEFLGYETGEAGLHPEKFRKTFYSGEGGSETEAGQLQRKAENEGIESLSHYKRIRVASRLLKIRGVEDARSWFKAQFGNDHDPELTNDFLRSLCEEYEQLPDYPSDDSTSSNVVQSSI